MSSARPNESCLNHLEKWLTQTAFESSGSRGKIAKNGPKGEVGLGFIMKKTALPRRDV